MNYRTYKGRDAYHSSEDHDQMCDTLMEAEAIKSDPKVMTEVNKRLKERAGHITSIAGLRKKASSLEDNDGNDPALETPARKISKKSDRTAKEVG